MITYFGNLPSIHCLPKSLTPTLSCTLTEVMTAAVYGAPLKPGKGEGSFQEQLWHLELKNRLLWNCLSGPGPMRPHLELLSIGKSWEYDPDTPNQDEQRTLESFRQTRIWLEVWRKKSAQDRIGGTINPSLIEKANHLAAFGDHEAIQFALAEIARIECASNVTNTRGAKVYRLLSEAINAQQIALKAIAADPLTGKWIAVTKGEPAHKQIPIDYFELPFVHDLRHNELEVNRYSSEIESLDSIFNGVERAKDDVLVKWTDVRVSAEHASRLLSSVAANFDRTDSEVHRPILVNAPPLPKKGDAALLKAAFEATYPKGVPRGVKVGEVQHAMGKWIKETRRREPPQPITFVRNRKYYWRDQDNS